MSSTTDKIKGTANEGIGKAKQGIGEATGSDKMKGEGAVQEINASRDEVLECVLVRSDGEAVAINLDIEPVEKPRTVLWVDPVHRDPGGTT